MSALRNVGGVKTESTVPLAPNVTVSLLTRLIDRVDVPRGRSGRPIVAPFTQTTFATVPDAEPDDVSAAATRAREAQALWAATPVSERLGVFSKFHDLLVDNADVALDLVQLEAGKARVPAAEEVYDTVATTHYYLKTARSLLRRRRRAVSFPGFTTAYEYRKPVGVVGSISPWNFPFTLAISDIVPALIAGNAVVSKPDEKTPFSLLFGAELLARAGLPPGVLQVVTGPGEKLGERLIDDVDFVMFTGSTEVGRLVGERAGRRLIRSSMELGGKNAAIVLDDADLTKTVPGISRAVFANGGQLCIAMERIYVDEKIREEFTTRFVEHTRNLRITADYDFSSAMSAMITPEHVERVHTHVEDAVDNGATLLTGGKPRPDIGPTFYEPTVLTDVDEAMDLCRTETFGPVVSIYGVSGPEEAIAHANDSDFGLNHSVWGRDVKRAMAVAEQLMAGTVGVNDGYAAVWSSYGAPMGGMKASGHGRRHGSEGLLKYTEAQSIAIQRIGPAFAPPGDMSYPTYHSILGPALKLLKRIPFYK